ncbi:putative ankyrin repeat protein [Mariannaea sp. PMI_226]|nr:putative ankyrin repeat protein [Mariannaea sp. PMI_226]
MAMKRRITTDEESDLEEFKEICPEDITVAIFCALSYESVAVKYSLDEEFTCRPQGIGPQKYIYSFGLIGEHNVVVARPLQTGTVAAAQCAATVCQQFINVRFALIIGIGAGIPNLPNRDIRLGDIAVSIPRDGHPGVLQYDFGKYEHGNKFVLKGSLSKPPPILVSADGSLEEDELMDRSRLRRNLRSIIKKSGYARPESGDILYDPAFCHVNVGGDCSKCEASSEKKVVSRNDLSREAGNPVVHRGLILSGSGVVKNTDDRDRLRRDHADAICYEMEAAGIMDEIPCLVVRGICDYADTHKQDSWHHYAAAVAAAYCKALLRKVYGSEIQDMRTMQETIQSVEKKLNEMNDRVHDLTRMSNEAQKATEHKEILDWLTRIDFGPQQSDLFRRRLAGTGQWLLYSAEFQEWLETSGKTLFGQGIPGAGKSILTSFLVDDLVERFSGDLNVGIAYIYCNFKRQEQQKVDDLLASLLKQLVGTSLTLPSSVVSLHNRHKARRTRPSLEEILDTLHSVLANYSRVFIVVDALDEYDNADGCRSRFLSQLLDLQAKTGTNLFTTSRYLPEIQKILEGSILLEIRAKSSDVCKYLQQHMSELPSCVSKNEHLQTTVVSRITEVADGMFLLAKLHLDSLRDKYTERAVNRALDHFRKGTGALDQAYFEAMERIRSQQIDFQKLALLVLSWITNATRPLTTLELQHALAVEPGDDKFRNDNIPEVENMVSVCIGLVTVEEESSIIRLVHYTTQDYFERTQGRWFPDAHTDITRTCVTYLSYSIFDAGICKSDAEFVNRLQSNPLYEYAAQSWGHHARSSSVLCPEVTRFLECGLKVEASNQALGVSQRMVWNPGYSQEITRNMTGLHMATYFGLEEATQALLQKGVEPDARDANGRTPLLVAAGRGQAAVAKLLLEKGPQFEEESDTPLLCAVRDGHEAVVKLLLEKGADIEAKRWYDGQTPLLLATKVGNQAVVKLLVEEGADIEAADEEGQTPLLIAIKKGHEAIFKLLLDKGANLEARDRDFSRTPLLYAVRNGNEAMLKLLEKSAHLMVSDGSFGWAPLLYAVENGDEAIVKMLLEKLTSLKSPDNESTLTPI